MSKKDFVLNGEVIDGKLTIFREELLRDYLRTVKGRIQIAFRPKRAKRSLNQNAYYWAILTQIGLELGYHKDEMHAIFGDKFRKEHATTTVKSTGEMVEIDYIRSTTSYNKVEFGEYLEKILQWSASYGIVVMTPDEYIALEVFDNPHRYV
jgi:hypothetical protein